MPSTTAARRSLSPPTRPRHVIDRALEYAALHADGLRAAEIARRRRKSKAYVSILLRLGQALGSCTPEEMEALRSPRITWKLAQRLVRTSTSDTALRQQLRLALGGFSSYTVDRRRLRKGRAGNDAELVRRSPDTFVWEWDPGWAERDPVGYAEAYLAFLTRLHRGVTARLRETGARKVVAPASPLVGQSIRHISRRLQSQAQAPTTAWVSDADESATARRTALALLAHVDGLLHPRRAPVDENE